MQETIVTFSNAVSVLQRELAALKDPNTPQDKVSELVHNRWSSVQLSEKEKLDLAQTCTPHEMLERIMQVHRHKAAEKVEAEIELLQDYGTRKVLELSEKVEAEMRSVANAYRTKTLPGQIARKEAKAKAKAEKGHGGSGGGGGGGGGVGVRIDGVDGDFERAPPPPAIVGPGAAPLPSYLRRRSSKEKAGTLPAKIKREESVSAHMGGMARKLSNGGEDGEDGDEEDEEDEEEQEKVEDSAAASDYDAAEPCCRFCFGTAAEGPNGAPCKLIKPCRCKGSVAYIHGACLERWIYGST